jgi:hypothetical protein
VLLLSTWLLLALGPVVTVEGDAVCPTAADVATRLGALLPARETDEGPDVARVEFRGSALFVTLARPDGTLIGERALESGFPCADLAAAAAVVVATWESDVHPEFRLAAPPPPAPPPPVPPPPAAPPVVAVAPAPPPAAARWEIGAGVSGSVAPGSGGAAPAMGALVVGGWTPAAGRVGARLALGATTERELPLGSASVRWQRADAALGAQLRLAAPGSRWAVDLFGEALAGWLLATGNGFTNDLSSGSLDPGLGGGARLDLGDGPLVPWLEVSLTGRLRRQIAYAEPGAASVELPRFEAALAAGLSFGR